jgi:hypothetical protein
VEKPAPSKESVKVAPASEAGKSDQEPKRSNAETRLTELLADLKTAGLSPAELKTFKREVQQAAQPKATPETTVKPAVAEAPKKPKIDDFKTIDEYEDAKDKYYEDLTEQRAKKLLADYRQEETQKASKDSEPARYASGPHPAAGHGFFHRLGCTPCRTRPNTVFARSCPPFRGVMFRACSGYIFI